MTATYGHWEVLKIEQVTGLTLDHAIRITFDASEAANVRASKVCTQLIQKNSDCLWGNLAKRIPALIAQCKGRSWTLVSLVAFKGNARRVHGGFFFSISSYLSYGDEIEWNVSALAHCNYFLICLFSCGKGLWAVKVSSRKLQLWNHSMIPGFLYHVTSNLARPGSTCFLFAMFAYRTFMRGLACCVWCEGVSYSKLNELDRE